MERSGLTVEGLGEQRNSASGQKGNSAHSAGPQKRHAAPFLEAPRGKGSRLSPRDKFANSLVKAPDSSAAPRTMAIGVSQMAKLAFWIGPRASDSKANAIQD